MDPSPDRGPGLHARGRGPDRGHASPGHHRARDGPGPDPASLWSRSRSSRGRSRGPVCHRLALGFALPDGLLVDSADRTVFALFFATALSISAIPVLAKILMDLDLMRREFGQTVLAAGMIDDITGWTMLGLVTALASAEAITAGSVVLTFAMVGIFILATVTVGRFVVERGLGLIQDRFRGRDAILTLVVVLAFAWGALHPGTPARAGDRGLCYRDPLRPSAPASHRRRPQTGEHGPRGLCSDLLRRGRSEVDIPPSSSPVSVCRRPGDPHRHLRQSRRRLRRRQVLLGPGPLVGSRPMVPVSTRVVPSRSSSPPSASPRDPDHRDVLHHRADGSGDVHRGARRASVLSGPGPAWRRGGVEIGP